MLFTAFPPTQIAFQCTGTSERFFSRQGVIFLKVCKQSYLHSHSRGETIQNQQDPSKICGCENLGYLKNVPKQI